MKKLTFVLLVISVMFLFTCSDSSKGKTADKYNGTLIYARNGDSENLDPAKPYDMSSLNVIDSIFESLVTFKPGTTEVIPGLAEKWEITPNGTEITFFLHKNVKFHDNTDFNADAVLFSFNRQLKTDHPYYDQGPWIYCEAMRMSSIIKDIVKVDNNTVKFILTAKDATFMPTMAMHFTAIVSPTAVAKYKKDFQNNPVGTGPFQFESWSKGDNITLKRFDSYWGGKAYLEKLIFKTIPDDMSRYLALKKGEVDIILAPPVESIEEIKKDSNLKIVEQSGMNIAYFNLNTSKKPFDNKLVRQAINCAVNKDEIITIVFNKYLGLKAKNPIPPSMKAYNDKIKDYDYSIEKAKELLKKAGYPDGFKMSITVAVTNDPICKSASKIAEIIQSQLKKVNIDVTIDAKEWGSVLDTISNGKHDSNIVGWIGDNGDPDNFFWPLLSGEIAKTLPTTNYALWNNEEFTSIIKTAKTVLNEEERNKLYFQAQEIFKEEAPWVPLAHATVLEITSKKVNDFVLYPTERKFFKNVWIDKK